MFKYYFIVLHIIFNTFVSLAFEKENTIEVAGGFDGANPQSQDSIIQETPNRFMIKPFNEKGSNDSYYFRFNTRVINHTQNPQPLELIIEWPALASHPDYPYETYYYGDMGNWKWTYGSIDGTEAKLHIYIPPGTTYLGCYPRYSYNYFNEFMNKLPEDKELKKWVAGKSFYDRNIWCVKITDPNVPNLKKTNILLTSRNHPYETSGSYISEEIIRFLQSNDSNAKKLKKEHIIYLIPMLNPDGVALDLNQQTRPGGVNISYVAESDDPAAKILLNAVDSFRPVLWADIHSWPHNGDDGMWCTHHWIAEGLLSKIPNRTFNNYIWNVSFVKERNTNENQLWQWLIRNYNSSGVSLSISWYRRNFLAAAGAGITGVALTNPVNAMFSQQNDLSRKIIKNGKKVRVALVGTGSRGTATWGANLIHPYSDYTEMVGLCDANRARLKVGKELIRTDAPVYHSSEFDKMIQQTNPDLVIVTTTDCFHADYVVRAMELGCDALSEKPLATEAEQCQRILDAEAKTGKTVWVGFNARHGQESMQAKKILASNELGKIISVEFHEYLDINHGASYYRRWHGRKEYSGSLLVHKASHHFDQINWWMNAEPVEVTAYGKVAFYGSNNSFRGEKCRGCQFKEQCNFYWDITKSDRSMKLYVDCEHEDGYIRDDCVWDHDINSYDTQTVQVLYDNGAILNYSLNSYMPYEGQQIAFNGTKGRLDIRNYHNQPWDVPYESEFRITKSFKGTETIKVGGKEGIRVASGNEGQENFRAQGERGGHGGADPHLKDLLLIPETPDPLNQIAGSHAGVASSLIGIAAVKSIESGGNPVKIADLIDYPKSWNWWGARR